MIENYHVVMNKNIEKIFMLCPSLALMDFDSAHSALVRMCIAHQLNGGEYHGLYETALDYLKSLGG
mgnify:FL=1